MTGDLAPDEIREPTLTVQQLIDQLLLVPAVDRDRPVVFEGHCCVQEVGRVEQRFVEVALIFATVRYVDD